MSKIICDVCGTSYPETATQCPICGCVRSVDARIVSGNTSDMEEETTRVYNHVKGGRFSKSNVKRRNNGKMPAPVETPEQRTEQPQEDGKKETGVIITTLAVILVIIAIFTYIVLRFFVPGLFQGKPADSNKNDNNVSVTDQITDTTMLNIPCEEIVLSKTLITFDSVDAIVLLNATANPAATTETVVFTSSNESVAVVTQDGRVTSVGSGEAIISVTCGSAKAECKVVCTVQAPEETTVEETISADELKLNREDFTMSTKGQTWKLYTGDIPADKITWTSKNEKVATIKKGVVTAVGTGTTTVHGEYGGVKVSCIVRCAASVGKADSGATEDTKPKGDCKISHEDVTIAAGKNFTLTLQDKDGKELKVSWVSSDTSICKVSGNTVTGVAKGNATVKTTYKDVTYTCIVRVTK
ncbi:MAG: Ig-like domain-containing protein [Oscillospiraceae bacterium]|nr:Ig-like domain-containing protein [Oscillospiraceae bacterium]